MGWRDVVRRSKEKVRRVETASPTMENDNDSDDAPSWPIALLSGASVMLAVVSCILLAYIFPNWPDWLLPGGDATPALQKKAAPPPVQELRGPQRRPPHHPMNARPPGAAQAGTPLKLAGPFGSPPPRLDSSPQITAR